MSGKGKKRGKDKKKKGKEEEEVEEKVVEPVPNADLIEVQLKLNTVTDRLNATEDENRTLHEKIQELTLELEAQKAEQADVYFYLHKKLDDNYDVIAGLERNILELQTEKERAAEDFGKQLDEQRSVSSSKLAALQEQLEERAEKLAQLNDFVDEKDEMEAMLSSLRAQLAAEKEAHTRDATELSRRAVQDKERLKSEMEMRVRETRERILAETEEQLHTTTKRTILENEQMCTELSFQSRETERLLGKHAALASGNAALKRELALGQELQAELAKKTHFYQKLLKRLQSTLSARDKEITALREALNNSGAGTGGDAADGNRPGGGASNSRANSRGAGRVGGRKGRRGLRGAAAGKSGGERAEAEVVAALQEKLGSLEVSMEQVCGELAATRRELGESVRQRDGAEQLQDETVNFLLTTLADAKAHMAANGGQLPIPGGGGGGGRRVGGGDNASIYTDEDGETVDTARDSQTGGGRGGGGGSGGGGDGPRLDELDLEQRQEMVTFLLNKMQSFQALLYRPRTFKTEEGYDLTLPPITPTQSGGGGGNDGGGGGGGGRSSAAYEVYPSVWRSGRPAQCVSVGCQTESAQSTLFHPQRAPAIAPYHSHSHSHSLFLANANKGGGRRASGDEGSDSKARGSRKAGLFPGPKPPLRTYGKSSVGSPLMLHNSGAFIDQVFSNGGGGSGGRGAGGGGGRSRGSLGRSGGSNNGSSGVRRGRRR